MIALAEPWLCGNEAAYVNDALRRNQLSAGSYVARFEAAFAPVAGCTEAIATSSGTTALHLLLAALNVGPGDEVLVPDLTFVATANAVRYCGARPVPVDVDPDTWALDPLLVRRYVTPRTVGLIAVHLYGVPADMPLLLQEAQAHGLWLVEDAAEAPGATLDGKPVGSFGVGAAFSFYGNKLITTGEGGMVTTNDARLAARCRLLRGQGMDPARRYWHTDLGYNYRMTELQGALGLGQVEHFNAHLAARRRVAGWYQQFGHMQDWQAARGWPAWWLNVALLPDREERSAQLARRGIETRPAFVPLHRLPIYADDPGRYPVADMVGRQGLCLPSHARLTADDVWSVCQAVVA